MLSFTHTYKGLTLYSVVKVHRTLSPKTTTEERAQAGSTHARGNPEQYTQLITLLALGSACIGSVVKVRCPSRSLAPP